MTAGGTFGGRYEVMERVGAGGMAEVYRARDELLGRDVAVKVLSERFSRDRSFVERFRREAQSAANLNHPNIVSLYDYGADDGTYFIVMEYIDGRSLDDIIKREGPLLPERAAEIASDVCQALQKAHAAGLIHRDIKPANIMITAGGQTKVTDFGIARAIARDGEQTMTQTGMVIGTASYLSPEQAQGHSVDARSDIYSMGCVLYEMLTAATPFGGDTPLAIAYKHVREDPSPPSVDNPDVPKALDAIVMKALAKNPDNRYASALEMKRDLDRFLGGQQVEATPLLADTTVGIPAGSETRVLRETSLQSRPPPRRRTGLWVLAIVLALALLGGLGYALFRGLGATTQVTVPSLIGKNVDTAFEQLNKRNLKASVARRSSTKPIDEVVDQDPRPPARIDEGDTVTLVVSSGPRQVGVPDLSGLTRREAEQALARVHLKLGSVTKEASDQVREGFVTAQDPAPRDKASAGSTVDVTISSGPETVQVPFVTNLPVDQAVAAIHNAGLAADITRGQSETVDKGVVISQDPAGGVDARAGDHVRILVSEGPQKTPLPDVTGQDAGSAQLQLQQLGLVVEQVPETEPCAQPPDTVCRQDPEPDRPVSRGDHVTLFVQPGGVVSPSPTASALLALLALLG